MSLNKIKKGKFKEIVALVSAVAITISNTLPISYAKENENTGVETSSNGVVAQPYIPENAQLDSNGKPVLDEEGRYVLLDEEGQVIPREVLDEYEIQGDAQNPVVYDITIDQDIKESEQKKRSTSVKKIVNLNSSNVNIRKTAGGTIIGKIPSGKVATVKGESGDYWQITYGSITGYVLKNTVQSLTGETNKMVKNITSNNVNIRSGASTSKSVIGKLPAGAQAEAVNVSGNWFQVVYGDIAGWVSKDYVKYANGNTGKTINLTSSSLSESIYFKDGPKNYKHLTSQYIKDASGRHVYCLDSEKKSPNGHPYTRLSRADDVTYRILKNGYPNKSLTGDAVTDRVITQAVIWSHLDSTNVKINNLVAVKNGVTDTKMLELAKKLYNDAKNGTDTQEVSIQFSNTSLNAKLNGEYFETDYITMVGKGDIKSAKITISAYDVDTNKQNTEVKIKDEKGTVLTSVGINQKFKISIPKTILKGSVKLVAEGDITHNIAEKYTSNLSGVQDSVVFEEAIERKTANSAVTWDGAGFIKIKKVAGNTGANLAGAEFSVKDSTGKIVATLKTDSNGEATTGGLALGKYVITETKAPEGYVIDTKGYDVEIVDNTTKTVTLKNEPIKGSIEVVKKDADNDSALEGAIFELQDLSGTVLNEAKTNSNGIATFKDVAYGEYIVNEYKAPTGYVVDKGEFKIKVEKNGEVKKLEVLNEKATSQVTFNKIDSKTGLVVEGAKMKIEGTSGLGKGKKIEFISSKNGNKFNLPTGKYTVTELEAPNGYVLAKNVKEFEIIKADTYVSVEFANEPIKGSIEILKVDEATKNPLKGAEFTLYDATGNAVKKAVSNEEGIVKFTDVAYGKYTIKETKAPENYVSSSATLNVEVKTNNQVIKHTVVNRKAGGTLSFTKTDVATGEIIPGAKIKIKGIEERNKDVEIEFISSTDGNRFELPLGKYEITETIAPEGYVLSKETQTFEIKEDGQVIKAELKNKLIEGNIKIIKKDADNSNRLEGATFELQDLSGKVLKEVTTDKEGMAVFTNVPYGQYIVREVKAPHGYVLSDLRFEVKVDKDGEIKELEVLNTKATGEVVLSKIDSVTGAVIDGAKMQIEGKSELNKGVKLEFISSKDGNKFKLPLGKYTVTELEAPEGYILSNNVIEFEITEKDQIIEVKFANAPIRGSVELTKVDAKDETIVLKDAEFALYNEAGEELAKAKTDESGVLKFENLRYGKYTIKELVAPEGYVLTDKILNIEIRENGQAIAVNFTNEKSVGEVDFSKTDVTTSEVIEGAKIEIYGVEERNKDVKIEFISSKDGNRFKLPIGKYEFKETLAPEGYVLTPEVGTFEIKANGEVVKATLANKPIVGSVRITKVDSETKEVLEGAEFALLDSESNEIQRAIVDENGVLVFEDLLYGSYKIKETVAPEGYILTPEIKNFDITKDGEVVEIVVENSQEPVIMKGSIEITKVDANKNEIVLQGAEFKLYNKDNEELATAETDASGKILFEELDLGEYYVKETKAPMGYQINEAQFKVNVEEDGQVVKLTVTNAQKLAQTGGNFSSSNLIFLGIALIGVAVALSERERRINK